MWIDFWALIYGSGWNLQTEHVETQLEFKQLNMVVKFPPKQNIFKCSNSHITYQKVGKFYPLQIYIFQNNSPQSCARRTHRNSQTDICPPSGEYIQYQYKCFTLCMKAQPYFSQLNFSQLYSFKLYLAFASTNICELVDNFHFYVLLCSLRYFELLLSTSRYFQVHWGTSEYFLATSR